MSEKNGNKPLTDKQEKFVQEFYADKREIISVEFVYRGLVTVYLESNEKGKEYAAWLITRIKPQYRKGVEEIVDIEELNAYANKHQAIKQKAIKHSQKRRHQKRDDFALTDEEWIETVEFFECECAYCGAKPNKLTYDHFKAFSKGGKFDKQNIVPACKKCNSSKNDREFTEWYPKQPFYSEERERRIYEHLGGDE